MTRLLTCKEFLQELNDYLEKTLEPAQYAELQKHVNECPNCFVVCDTTEKTLRVFKGMDCKPVPADIHARLMAAVENKMKLKCTEVNQVSDDVVPSTTNVKV